MTDYKNGLIYTIRSPHTEKIYIGSTCQRMSKRLYTHRHNYKAYKNGTSTYITSYKILELGDEYIELLEAYPCNSRIELHKREGELIREYKDICVNKIIAGRTRKEYYEDNIEHAKKYRQDNKEYIKQNKATKHMCYCGIPYRRDNIPRHNKSNRHIKYMLNPFIKMNL
jgi:hypothetical protein